MGSTLRWTVGGERMDYLSEVRSETLSGCSTGHGALGRLVEERDSLKAEVERLKEESRLSKEREAESDARLEWHQTEREAQEQRIQGLTVLNRLTSADLQAVCIDRKAIREERDRLKAEVERLRRGASSGYVNAQRVEIKGNTKVPPIAGTIEDLIASGVVTLGNEEVKSLKVDLSQATPTAILNNIKPLLQGLGSSTEIAGAISVAAVTLFTLWEQVKNGFPSPPKD